MLQQLYLSQRTLRQNLLAENIGDLLNRNSLLGLGIRSRAGRQELVGAQQNNTGKEHIPNNSISTLTKLLRHRISIIDNEVLVENLEHLSAYEVCHDVGMYVFSGLETVCESNLNFDGREYKSRISILGARMLPSRVADSGK
jgi:hypothetical protein